jgi:hypothetical protein
LDFTKLKNMKEIKESQQASQGITIGNSGNQGGAMPQGAKGPHDHQHEKSDKHIPNQERSSSGSREQEDKE